MGCCGPCLELYSVGDYGSVFDDVIREDPDPTVPYCDAPAKNISDATTRQVVFEKPDGTTVTKTAVNVTDGSDGALQYTVESGLFDAAGMWRYQFTAVGPTYSKTGRRIVFQVLPALT